MVKKTKLNKTLNTTYKDDTKSTHGDSKRDLQRKNNELLKESIALRQDSITVFKKILDSKEIVGNQIAEHAPTAIEVLAGIMNNKDVSAQTRALIAWGFVDRVGASTAQVNKELENLDNSSNNPDKMTLDDISAMLSKINQQINDAKVVSPDSEA